MPFPEYPGAENWGVRAGKASSRGGADIDRIIVHVMVGSYEGSMRWANDSPDNSFHYGVSLNARIGQAVTEKWAAWHAGNWPVNKRSIGIEHEDLQRWNSPGWWTEKQMRASAKLAAHLCKKYSIPADREHILPHWQVASDGRACPGPHFPLDWYIELVRSYLGGEPETWRGSRWQWCQDNSAPAPAVLTYEDRDIWRIERVYSNPERLPTMSRWQWCQDNSAPAPAVLTYNGEPAWKVTRI